MTTVEELGKDLKDLEKLNTTATRQRVKNILSVEISKLETEIKNTLVTKNPPKPAESTDSSKPKLLKEKITKYGFDQSEKFMKLYITLNNVQNGDKDKVTARFDDRSVQLEVSELGEKSYEFSINNLCEQINVEESYHKIKTDMVLIMLKKKNPGLNWTHVTASEKQKSDKDKSEMSPKANEDPNAGMMKMLQKMYEEGDDDMKRTIAKSMSESQNKAPMM